MISFRIERFDLLSLQGILESLLQPHNSKVLVLWRSDFFMVQLLHWYITGKTVALTIQTYVGKVISLLFNTVSGFVMAFLNNY